MDVLRSEQRHYFVEDRRQQGFDPGPAMIRGLAKYLEGVSAAPQAHLFLFVVLHLGLTESQTAVGVSRRPIPFPMAALMMYLSIYEERH